MEIQLFTPNTEDWIDIYIDNHKVYGGHSISPYMLLQILSQIDNTIKVASFTTWDYIDDGRPTPKIHGEHLGERYGDF